MKSFRFTVLLFLMIIAVAEIVTGAEIRRSHQFIRAIAMGDAFTAVADSRETIAYNPAGLLQKNVEWSLSLPLLGAGFNENIKDPNEFAAKYDFEDTSTLEDLVGERVSFSTNLFPVLPSLYVPNKGLFVGFEVESWVEMSFPSSFLVIPKINLEIIGQAVLEYGMAFEVFGFNVGANLKGIYRVGMDKRVDLISVASLIEDKKYDQIIEDYAEDQPGLVMAMDFGLLYRFDHPWNPRIGISSLDSVSVNIEKGEMKWGGIDFKDAGEVKQLNSIGFAMTRTLDEFEFTGSLDYHDFTFDYFDSESYTRRISLGLEVGYDKRADHSRLASFQLGLKELKYPSFGMTYTLGIFKFSTVRWIENFGTDDTEMKDTRYMFLLSFIF